MATFQPDMLATYRSALDNTVQTAAHGQNMRLQDFYRRKGPEFFPGNPTLGELAQIAPDQAFALQASQATAAEAAKKAQLESARRLINGVMSLPESDRPAAYRMAREIAMQYGWDVSGFGEEYDPQRMAVAQVLFNKSDEERTEFERILGTLPEGSPEYNAAVRQYLKLDPPPKAAEKPPAPTKYRYIDPNDPTKGVELTPGWKDTTPGIRIVGPDGTTVETGNPENFEPAQGRELGKVYATTQAGIRTAAMTARDTLRSLDTLGSQLDDPAFYSGIGAETLVQPLKRLGVALNAISPEEAASMETFQAVAGKLVLDMAGGTLGTQISNADREFLERMKPNLSNTPEGNKLLVSILRKVAKREIEVQEFMHGWLKAHPEKKGLIDYEFDMALNEWVEANPLFTTTPATATTEPVPGAAPAAAIKPVPKSDPGYSDAYAARARQIAEGIQKNSAEPLTREQLIEETRRRLADEGWSK